MITKTNDSNRSGFLWNKRRVNIMVFDSKNSIEIHPTQSENQPTSNEIAGKVCSKMTDDRFGSEDLQKRGVLPENFEQYFVDFMNQIEPNSTDDRHLLIFFYGSDNELNKYDLLVDGQRMQLKNQMNKMLIYGQIREDCLEAFILAVLCFVNRRINQLCEQDINIPLIRSSAESEPERLRSRLEKLIRFYEKTEDHFANWAMPEMLSRFSLEHFKGLPIDLETKMLCFVKFNSFLDDPSQKKKMGKRAQALVKMAFLVDGGDASMLVELFSYLIKGWSSKFELVFLVENVDFWNFDWKEVTLKDVKNLLVSIYEKLISRDSNSKLNSVHQALIYLTRKFLDNLVAPKLSFGDFEAFFDFCQAEKPSANITPELVKFCFYEFSSDQLSLIHRKHPQLLLGLIFELIDFGSNGDDPLECGRQASQNRAVFESFFVAKKEFKMPVLKLEPNQFWRFNLEISSLFLESELKKVDNLKIPDSKYYKAFDSKLKGICLNEFLQKQLECEDKFGNQNQKMFGLKVDKLVQDEPLLQKMLKSLSRMTFYSDQVEAKKVFQSILNFVLNQIEGKFAKDNLRFLKNLEIRMQLLTLIAKSLENDNIFRIKKLLLFKFNEHFNYEGKLRIYRELFEHLKKFKTKNDKKADSKSDSEPPKDPWNDIYTQIRLVDGDYDLANEDFWEQVVVLAKREPRFDAQFGECLAALDGAFRYSEKSLDKQVHLLHSTGQSHWERVYFETQLDAFKRALRDSLAKESVFAPKHAEQPDLFKFVGLACNPKLLQVVKLLKRNSDKFKSNRWNSSEKEPFQKRLSQTKLSQFLEAYAGRIKEGEMCFYEAVIVRNLRRKLGLTRLMPLSSECANPNLERLFSVLDAIEKDPFLSQVVDLQMIHREMDKQHLLIEQRPEKSVEVSSFLDRIEQNGELLENTRNSINRNGLVYALGKEGHWALLERVLEVEQLVQLKTCLAKWAPGEREQFLRKLRQERGQFQETFVLEEEEVDVEDVQNEQEHMEEEVIKEVLVEVEIETRDSEEYPRVTVEELIQCAQSNRDFLDELKELHNSWFSKFKTVLMRKEKKLSFSRISFLMFRIEVDQLKIPFLKKVHKQVTYLRNSEDFCMHLQVLSRFFQFSCAKPIQKQYADFLRIYQNPDIDDFGSILESTRGIPKIFKKVSGKPDSLLHFLTLLGSQEDRKSTPNPSTLAAGQDPLLAANQGGLRKRAGHADRLPGARPN